MNSFFRFRWVALTAIAFSPFSLATGAIAAPTNFVVPTVPINAPIYPNTSSVVIPTPSRNPSSSVVIPTTPRPTLPRLPATTPGNATPSPIRTLPPIPTPSTSGSGTAYRVVVLGNTDIAQNQVKAVVPGAFRTSINGQSAIQAGVFREQRKATELQQMLSRNNLQAMVMPIAPGEINFDQSPPPINNPVLPKPLPKGTITVVLDPGHGGNDPGAVGIGGLQEKDVTLAISQQVAALLKQQGINAVLSRSNDAEIDLDPRVTFAEKENATVFVSIHANSFDADRTDVNGIETYYYAGQGEALAETIHKNLIRSLGVSDRGVKQANFYVIKYTPMPSTLVEVGFVTGASDAARLASASGRAQIAQAIAQGILQYVH